MGFSSFRSSELVRLSCRFLDDYVRRYPLDCFLTSFLSVASVALQVPLPLLSIRIIDQFLPARDTSGLVRTFVLISVLLVLRHICYFVGEKKTLELRESLIRDVQSSTFSNLLRAPLSFFSNNHSGYLQTRVTSDARMVEGSLVRLLVSLAVDGLTFAVVLACLAYIRPLLALLIGLCLVPFAVIRVYANDQMGRLSAELQEETAQNAAALIEAFTGIRTIKLFSFEQRITATVARSLSSVRDINVRINLFAIVSNTGASFFGGVTSIVALGYGAYAVLHSLMTVGELFATFSLLTFLFGPINTFVSANQRLQQSTVALKRLYSFRDLQLEPVATESATYVRLQGHVRFSDVSFNYPKCETILHTINLKITPGSPLAIAGRSGCGKSTMVGLLARLYDSYTGEISIDGISIRDLPLEVLRSNLGFVDQVPFLFDGTIRDNLLVANPLAKDDVLLDVCGRANILELIHSLPSGLDTRVGERGTRLSGGQAQRICLARMFLKDPPILVLDEALSSVDTESEAPVLSALQALIRDRSTIMISHRLSSLSLAEKVAVLEDGTLIEEGTPTELMRSPSAYASLFGDQIGLLVAS